MRVHDRRIAGIGSRWILLLVLLAAGQVDLARTAAAEKPRRARLPDWKTFPSDIFFKDAFREALVGPRPTLLGARAADSPVAEKKEIRPADNTFRWSAVVTAETLEDEVKVRQIALETLVTTPAKFSSGGYLKVRRDFSALAMLFAVIAEYDLRIRWKDDAPAARDLFARAAAHAKTGSSQAYNEAKLRKLDLQDMVRGGKLNSTQPAERAAGWDRVGDRGPLMERLAQCQDERLAVWTARKAEFSDRLDDIRHEAELAKLIAAVLTREGMEDADDDEYVTYSRQLGGAAQAVLEAVEREDNAAARKAVSQIGVSCDRCHEVYRP